jgi:multiple sugar transport system permease protein/raffinose/stachyose/melibiose transport system permease protein
MSTRTTSPRRAAGASDRAESARSNRRRQAATHPWWFAFPAFAVLAVFFFLPTLFNFVYAFTDWSSFKSAIGFVGLKNFETLLSSGDIQRALRVTLTYAVLVAVFQNLFGLLLALLLERDTRVNRAARTVFFIPVIMSALAVGYVFQALLKPDGVVNSLLSGITGHTVDTAWLGNTTWTMLVVALIHAWKWMGLPMLIYLAGLKTISAEVLEAATIDGAGPWTTFWRVRFPLIAPAVTFNVATALLGSMNGFDIVQATTAGGPARSTELLNIFIFRTFGQGLFAQATTMSLVLFLVVVVLAFPVIGMLRRREDVL